ncbi:hypothetical protein QTJ16_006753 [Diplocarpon rosae]|uniref:Uncharacterized protein n=1 Tax=Diplocarpon rosae TaxID=946125 RepID=A0AAD9SVY4_9HELO|nr:hypothetical protein QTJ16_006753 [Diplocarpon rosae]
MQFPIAQALSRHTCREALTPRQIVIGWAVWVFALKPVLVLSGSLASKSTHLAREVTHRRAEEEDGGVCREKDEDNEGGEEEEEEVRRSFPFITPSSSRASSVVASDSVLAVNGPVHSEQPRLCVIKGFVAA